MGKPKRTKQILRSKSKTAHSKRANIRRRDYMGLHAFAEKISNGNLSKLAHLRSLLAHVEKAENRLKRKLATRNRTGYLRTIPRLSMGH